MPANLVYSVRVSYANVCFVCCLIFTNVVRDLSLARSDSICTRTFAVLPLHTWFANGVCKLSLHVHVYKLCFAILNDQLGVANFAYTLGLHMYVLIILFYMFGLRIIVFFAIPVYTFLFCNLC